MSDLRRFAGFPSPGTLAGDPSLTRADKIDALESWRWRVARDEPPGEAAPAERRLIGEISRALALLERG